MPATKKNPQKKKAPQASRESNSKLMRKNASKKLAAPVANVAAWRRSLRPNSPHRSFRRTYARDASRPISLSNYPKFTLEVTRTLWKFKSTFFVLILVYTILSALFVGWASQANYSQLGELLRTTGGELLNGGSTLGDAGLLLFVGLSGELGVELTESEQLLAGLLTLLGWLVTIWLLRAFLAGHRPNLKDAFYTAGAPIVPTVLLSAVLVLQLIPAAIAMIAISALLPSGIISGGIEAMLFWIVTALLMLLSLYWISSTFIALVIVTLPGMYPLRALKNAHELVVGRRLKIVLRMCWLALITSFTWALIMVPIIIFDAWLKGVWQAIDWVPIVPFALLIGAATTLVWATSYIYLLYRGLVADETVAA